MNDVSNGDGVDEIARSNAGLVSVNESIENIGVTTRTVHGQLQTLGRFGTEFTKSLSTGVDQLTRGMSDAFEKFLTTGKLSFADLKNVAIDVLDSIYERAVSAGLDQIFGGISGGLGDVFGGIFSGGPILSFAPRATGGPVSAGRPFLVGESGPELFIPGQSGSVLPRQASASSAINVTINMSGNAGGSPGAMRQSASQIAAQVSRAVTRAQRNG